MPLEPGEPSAGLREVLESLIMESPLMGPPSGFYIRLLNAEMLEATGCTHGQPKDLHGCSNHYVSSLIRMLNGHQYAEAHVVRATMFTRLGS